MNVVNSTVSQLPFAQQHVAPEAASKTAVEHALPSSVAVTQDIAAKSAGRDNASIEYEMFADEGDRFNRTGRGLGSIGARFFKKKKLVVPDSAKAPEAVKLGAVDVNKPGTSGTTAFDKDIAKEQAEFKPEGSQASKLVHEEVKIVEPASLSLTVPNVSVNGKAVSPFSSEALTKAKKEFEDAAAAADANKTEMPVKKEVKADADTTTAPAKPKLSDTKKLLVTATVGAAVTALGTFIAKLIEKTLSDDPATKFKVSLAEAKIIDRVQQDVFGVVTTLHHAVGKPDFDAGFDWSLKTDAERIIALEAMTIELEKAYANLGVKFDVETHFDHSRSDDPDVAVRAKIIESRLAVIIAISNEIAPKMNAKVK